MMRLGYCSTNPHPRSEILERCYEQARITAGAAIVARVECSIKR
jgi:hypothetical protein